MTNILSFESFNEAKKTNKKKKNCWVGYEQKGTKKKGGRTVPNCVPIKINTNN